MDYRIIDSGKQMRFRTCPKAGEPTIDLSEYRFSVCIDTLKLKFVLGRAAKTQTLKQVVCKALREAEVFLKAEDQQAIRAGWGATTWTITIQDATRKRVDALILALVTEYGVSGEIDIVQIDVALDARLKGAASNPAINTPDKRLPIFEVFRERLAVPQRERFAGAGWRDSMPRDDREYWHYADRVGPLPGGMLLSWYYGSSLNGKGSKGFQVCLYDKVTDHNKQTLPLRDHRVRVEVQLTQEGLKRAGISELKTLAELATFNFQKLRKEFFNFQLTTVPETYVGKEREPRPPIVAEALSREWAKERNVDPGSAPDWCRYDQSELDWARISQVDVLYPYWLSVAYERLNERVRKAFEQVSGW